SVVCSATIPVWQARTKSMRRADAWRRAQRVLSTFRFSGLPLQANGITEDWKQTDRTYLIFTAHTFLTGWEARLILPSFPFSRRLLRERRRQRGFSLFLQSLRQFFSNAEIWEEARPTARRISTS